MNQLVPISSPTVPALVAPAGERPGMRFLEFFAANIRNPHTRRAYRRAPDDFLAWCVDAGVPSIAAVQPVHVATWIEAGTRELAAIRSPGFARRSAWRSRMSSRRTGVSGRHGSTSGQTRERCLLELCPPVPFSDARASTVVTIRIP